MFSAAGKSAVTSGYNINNSLRLRSSASAYLSRTPASAGNRRTWTLSMWFKLGALPTADNNLYRSSSDAAANQIWVYFNSSNSNALNFGIRISSTNYQLQIAPIHRDPSAWYHLVYAVDTTQATSSNRAKIYINGQQVTTFLSSSYPPQNSDTSTNNTGSHAFGSTVSGGGYFDGYMTEVNFIDGSALGKDFSGNGNYWTTNNISVTSGVTYDAMIDSPTNGASGTQPVGNYCTLNPLESFTNPVPQQANLYVPGTDYSQLKGTMSVSTGKWYFEWVSIGSNLPPYVGVSKASITSWSNVTTSGISWYGHNESYYKNFTATSLVSVSAMSVGDIIGVAFDCDAGTVAYYKNNTLVHTDTTLTPNELVAPTLIGTFSGGSWSSAAFNFGQRPFAYTPPTGYQALCTTNLPDSTIKKGNLHMDATAYTGTNGSPTTQVISSNFQPDLLWFKKRSASYDHGTLVAWTWKAGGTSTVNTSGTISSNVSVNATAGFSVVTYTGNGSNSTVGHGLGVAPKMIIVKNRTTGAGNGNWAVYHASLGATKYLLLNTSDAAGTSSTRWNDTAPSSTVFTVGITGTVNDPSNNYVAYCFAEIAGFSKFTTYTGNGSTDGPFVYLGFRPKFVMVKGDVAGVDWAISDSTRNTYNVVNARLQASLTNAEDTGDSWCDFLSNGFKIRSTNTNQNYNGYTFIVMAFAENPFKNALAR